MEGRSLLSDIPPFPLPIKKKNTTKKRSLSYAKMVRETLSSMSKTSTTSSKAVSSQAIARYLTSHFGVETVNLPDLNKALQRGVESGAFRKVKKSYLLIPKAPVQKKQKKKSPATSTPSPRSTPAPTPAAAPTSRPNSQTHEGKYEVEIKNFKQKQHEAATNPHHNTESFSLAGQTWCLLVFPLGNHQSKYLSVYLVPEGAPLKKELKMKFSLKGKEHIISKKATVTFVPNEGGRGMSPRDWGFKEFVALDKLEEKEGSWCDENGGFTIVVEAEVQEC